MLRKEDQNEAFTSDYLKYGSEISFSYQDIGYITSSGFIDNLLYLKSGENLDYSQCLFRVFPFCIHSIQNNLHQEIKTLKSVSEYTESYQKISDSLEGEIRSNLLNYEKNRGKCVRFGSLVYLQHVASHKFLTVIPEENSQIEKYNVKVALTDFPNDYSYIKIEPSYNFQREGEGLIRTNDIVQLVVFLAEMNKPAYINASGKDYKELPESTSKDWREINASFDVKVKWRINLFSFTPRDKQKLLNYGDCIWISHSEGGVIFNTLKTDDSVFMFFNSNSSDSNGLWRIERTEMTGGYVYTAEEFLLKHLTTGLYLSLENGQGKSKPFGSLKPRKDACSWKFVSIYDWEQNVKIEIDHFFYLVHATEDVRLLGKEDNEHLAYIRLKFSNKTNEEAFFKIFKAESSVLWETQFTINCYEIISRFSEIITTLTCSYEDLKVLLRSSVMIRHCLEQMCDFLQHKLCSSFSTGKNYGQIDASRQKTFKENQILDVLSTLLDNLFSKDFNLAKVLKDDNEKLPDDNFSPMMNCLKDIAKKAYNVLGIACQDNRQNQVYTFKFFSVYQKHGGYDLGATQCMKSVLMNNEDLMSCLEEKSIAVQLGRAGASVIEHYIWLLRKFFRDRKPRLIEFLSDICACDDVGITVNQNSIHEKLFLNPQTYNKGIIATSLETDEKKLFVVFQHKVMELGKNLEKEKEKYTEMNVALVECFESDGTVKEIYKDEISYFINMIQLFANLCKGRNEACKASISKWFPIDVLKANIWEVRLSTEIRAAFLQMMVNMHVDASPRVAVKKPELIRALNSSKKHRELIFQRHTIKDLGSSMSNYLAKKKTVLIKNESAPKIIFEEKDGEFKNSPIYEFKVELIRNIRKIVIPEFNFLLLQMLKAVNLLINFEVISNDKGHDEGDIDELLHGANIILFYNIQNLINNNKEVKGNLQDFHEKAKNKEKQLKTNADDPFRRFSEGLRHFLKYHTFRSTDQSEVENIEIKCKLELCDLLFHAIDLRQDFLISNVIKWFMDEGQAKARADNSENRENNEDLEKKISFDIQKLIPALINPENQDPDENSTFQKFHSPSVKHLISTIPNIFENLLHLFVTTKNYKFQTKILGIVLRMFSQRKEMIKNLKKITFMIHETDGDIYLEAKEHLSTFKYFSDQALVICSYWKQKPSSNKINLNNLNQCLEILKKIKGMVFMNDLKINPEILKKIKGMVFMNDLKINPERQGMLRYLNFHLYVIKFISLGFPILEDLPETPKKDSEVKAKALLTEVFQECFKTLTIFVMENRKNQFLVYESLEVLLRTMRVKMGQIDLICEIFKKNVELCNKIDERLILIFKEMILHEGRKPEFLQFYDTVIMINNEPIAHLQRLILSALTKNDETDTLLFMKNKKFDFDSDFVGDGEKDNPCLYHAVLIRVLAKCGYAAYGFKLSRNKCQRIIPLDEVYKLLKISSPPSINEVHLSLLDFLMNVYLNDEYLTRDDLNSGLLEFINNCISSHFKMKKVLTDILPFILKVIMIIYKYIDLIRGKLLPKAKDLSKIIGFIHKKYHEGKKFLVPILENIQNYLQILKTLSENDPDSLSPVLKELNYLYIFFEIHSENSPQQEAPLVPNSSTVLQDNWHSLIISLKDQKFSKLIKEETRCFLERFRKIESKELSKNQILQGLLDYISLSSVHRPPSQIVCSVIEFLGYNLTEADSEEKGEKELNKKKSIQLIFREMNVVQIIMKLMCDVHIDPEIFAILIDFSTKLLDGGNEKIQQDFYDYFLVKSSSEHFFAALYTRLSDFTKKIAVISDVERINSRYFKKSRKMISNIIKLMQLFCENHYETLQNYLRIQEKSRNSYDLVGAVTLLLRELMVKKRVEYFLIMSNCFELLTECIQGPCKSNQKAIINSKFLEIVSELLSIDETAETIKSYEGLNMIYETIGEKLLFGWMISHLKYKCLITLIALLEGRTDNYVITRMFRAFNLLLFKKNLISVYSLYLKDASGAQYDNDLFEKFKGNEKYKENTNGLEGEQPRSKLIIEIGFMVFQLICYFTEIDDPDIKKAMINDFPELYNEKTDSNFSPFEMIGRSFMNAKKILRRQENPSSEDLLKAAVLFFKSKTGDIEVVFKGTINKIYFWLPPVCEFLTSEAKNEFHEQADRSSEKAKIEYMVNRFSKLKDDMEYEQKLIRNVLGYRFLSSKIALFKVALFLLTLYLNFLLLFSYNNFNGGRLDKPELGYIQVNTAKEDITSSSETISHIYAVGIVHCILSCMIFLYFTVKTIPLIIKTELKGMKEDIRQVVKVLRVFRKVSVKVDVIYQFGFCIFSIFGLAWHPFFFSIHLLDILYRIPSLQSVIMSVVLPWKSLVLVFFLIVIINYLFSIWAYVDFAEEFAGNCESLLLCFRTIFDQAYKNSGGIGMWLDYNQLYRDETNVIMPEFRKNDVISRFFFDDLYMIIIPILLANIIYGLILDNFTVLKLNDDESNADRNNKCFICGKAREDIERLTSKSFKYHVVKEHSEWNYIYFIAYLDFKKSTEHSGIESDIKTQINDNKHDWIPQQQGLSFKNEEINEENQSLTQIKEISESLAKFEQEVKKLKKSSNLKKTLITSQKSRII